jgi:hypothetical protein
MLEDAKFQLGTPSNDNVLNMDVGDDGSIFIVGQTGGDIVPGEHQGGVDLFVASLKKGGGLNWIDQIGSVDGDEQEGGVACSGSNYVYASLHTHGDFDGHVNMGSSDVYILKYDIKTGEKLISVPFGTASTDQVFQTAVDPSGDVIIAGHTFGTLEGNQSAGDFDTFVAKFTSDLEVEWIRQKGSSDRDTVSDMVVDQKGDIYITGLTDGNYIEGAHKGGYDLFFTKYAGAGIEVWSVQEGSSLYDRGQGIGVDYSFNVFVISMTTGDLGGDPYPGPDHDALLIKHVE